MDFTWQRHFLQVLLSASSVASAARFHFCSVPELLTLQARSTLHKTCSLPSFLQLFAFLGTCSMQSLTASATSRFLMSLA